MEGQEHVHRYVCGIGLRGGDGRQACGCVVVWVYLVVLVVWVYMVVLVVWVYMVVLVVWVYLVVLVVPASVLLLLVNCLYS